jgi:hypothetical protein
MMVARACRPAGRRDRVGGDIDGQSCNGVLSTCTRFGTRALSLEFGDSLVTSDAIYGYPSFAIDLRWSSGSTPQQPCLERACRV